MSADLTGYSIHTNGIVIIDYLAPEEYASGQSIFESYVNPTWTECKNKFYYRTKTKNEFFNHLKGICEAVIDQQFCPIIHIEAHGNQDGFSNTPTGGEVIRWSELKPYLQYINRHSGFNLLLVMSCCEGAYILKELTPYDPAPFWGLIGPKDVAQFHDLIQDFGSFYSIFLKEFSFTKAYSALNRGNISKDRNYQFGSAEYFFIALFALYIPTHGSKEAIKRRADRMINQLPGATRVGRRRQGMMRQKMSAFLADHHSFFEKFKHTYFMEDQYPEMSKRFNVSYEKVLESIAKQRQSGKSAKAEDVGSEEK